MSVKKGERDARENRQTDRQSELEIERERKIHIMITKGRYIESWFMFAALIRPAGTQTELMELVAGFSSFL